MLLYVNETCPIPLYSCSLGLTDMWLGSCSFCKPFIQNNFEQRILWLYHYIMREPSLSAACVSELCVRMLFLLNVCVLSHSRNPDTTCKLLNREQIALSSSSTFRHTSPIIALSRTIASRAEVCSSFTTYRWTRFNQWQTKSSIILLSIQIAVMN